MLADVLRLGKTQKKKFIITFIFLFCVNVLQLFIPLLLGNSIGEVVHSPDATYFIFAALKILGIGIVIFLLRFVWRVMLSQASLGIAALLRVQMYKKLLGFSQYFYQKFESGDIVSRVASDIQNIRGMYAFGVIAMFDTFVLGSITLLLMFFLNAKLTLIALIPLVFLIFVVLYFENKIHETSENQQKSMAQITAYAQECFFNVFTIKSFNQEKYFVKNFEKLGESYIKNAMRLGKLSAIFDPSLYLIVGISMVLVLYFGGIAVMEKRLALGTLIAFTFYVDIISWPIMAIGFGITMYQRGTASLKRVNEILTYNEPECQHLMGTETKILPQDFDIHNIKPEITIKDLNFAWSNGKILFENLTLHVPAGKVVGILGPVGCGKTTLLHMLTRLLPVSHGQIFVGGIDINDIPLQVLRKLFAVAPQDSFLFSATIRDNVAFSDENLSDADVWHALEQANLSTFVRSLPDGLATLLGERGVNLSGGQKQRLSLARALAKQSPILLLDDVFSSVDSRTEAEILASIGKIKTTRTIVMVTHRISSLQHADLIYVIDHGTVVECGSHAELLMRKGYYWNIYEKQALESKIQGVD